MKTMKGQIIDRGMGLAMTIVIIVFTLGAGAIGMAGLYSSVNILTSDIGANRTAPAINNGSFGLLNMSLQMPSVGTLAGVSILLLVLFGAFYLFLKKND